MAIDDVIPPLNCPHCGRRMRFVDANSPMRPVLETDPPAAPTLFVFQCSTHGLHHLGPLAPLTAGPTPSTVQ